MLDVKKRNIQDIIFVLQAILNDTRNGSKQQNDINIYDIEKCFDSLWVQDWNYDIYDAGVQSDKLNILHILSQYAQVAVKTTSGLTKRETISNTIMQGTVWGGIFCTTSMDKLGKLKYEDPEKLYNYKGVVGIPALEMVDDILDIQKCGIDSVQANAIVNTFVEHKKLKMGQEKCHKIHCNQKFKFCPNLTVHDKTMHQSNEEKYLGDHIHKNAKNAATISRRRAKGYGIISDIMYILDAIPNGKRRINVGLQLRQSWFLNSLLLNMETWHNVQDSDLKVFMKLDQYLLRKIIGAQSKVPIEFLYLETSAIPVDFVLSSRRLNFLQTVLAQNDTEMTKRI